VAPLRARVHGVLDRVDLDGVLGLATRERARIWIARAAGEAVSAGAPIAWMWRDPPPEGEPEALDEEEVSAALHAQIQVRTSRVQGDEINLGIRHLVDIAIRALSPAVNDPYTANQVLDELSAILFELRSRRTGPIVLFGDDEELRVLIPAPTFADFLRLSTDQIIRYGAGDPTVLIRICALVREVASAPGESGAAELGAVLDLVERRAERALEDAQDLERIRNALAHSRAWMAGDQRPKLTREQHY
jgi:uncharacterized membrane protein